LSTINSSLFAINTPLFVQGSGSMIRIGMNLNYTGILLGPVVVNVVPGSIADSIGMSRGSVIHKIAGKNIIYPDDISKILKSDLGKAIQITWRRQNHQQHRKSTAFC
jgi:C-terminal processing protease CtpA/Prc